MLFDQLSEDFRNSYKNCNQNAAQDVFPSGLVLANLDENWQNAPHLTAKPIYEWMGLEIDFFPPSIYWTEEQLKLLCSNFRQLFEAYRYFAVIPWTITLDEEYDAWLKAARKVEVCWLGVEGSATVEPVQVCQDVPSTCPFKEHCMHKDGRSCIEAFPVEQWNRYL